MYKKKFCVLKKKSPYNLKPGSMKTFREGIVLWGYVYANDFIYFYFKFNQKIYNSVYMRNICIIFLYRLLLHFFTYVYILHIIITLTLLLLH